MDAISKVEQERESLVQAIQQELQKMRQENARIIAEQVEKRVKQELEWHDASVLKPAVQKQEEPEPAAAEEEEEKKPEEKKPVESSFVDQFLSKCGLLEVYGARFAEMGYDSELAIKLMDNADLDTLGITALGHRRILLNAVKMLNSKQ